MRDRTKGAPSASASSVPILAYDHDASAPRFDDVAREEPLQIRLVAAGQTHDVAVTMRTPGNDFELAVGFLFSEGIVRTRSDVESVSYCIDDAVETEQQYNIVHVQIRGSAAPAIDRLERHFAIGSACGLCGKAQLDDLQIRGIARIDSSIAVSAQTLIELPQRLQEAQRAFAYTGGLHASGLFDSSGALLAIREDIGRHNAMDKLIGWGLMNDRLPFSSGIALV
ncbi:MAG: formate dehydrogenase accessory sulfurtransferase FdhD, partial [Candidatus Eremiobacteraeota bacterium]|nr:formate dehydrogenase accessory sulfurtransferase FdhD [Candidatus Eremiobacteraeota bacterium]